MLNSMLLLVFFFSFLSQLFAGFFFFHSLSFIILPLRLRNLSPLRISSLCVSQRIKVKNVKMVKGYEHEVCWTLFYTFYFFSFFTLQCCWYYCIIRNIVFFLLYISTSSHYTSWFSTEFLCLGKINFLSYNVVLPIQKILFLGRNTKKFKVLFKPQSWLTDKM